MKGVVPIVTVVVVVMLIALALTLTYYAQHKLGQYRTQHEGKYVIVEAPVKASKEQPVYINPADGHIGVRLFLLPDAGFINDDRMKKTVSASISFVFFERCASAARHDMWCGLWFRW